MEGASISISNGEAIPEPPIINHENIGDDLLDFFSELHAERLEKAHNFSSYSLPNFSRSKIETTYNRLTDAERALVAPNLEKQDYDDGTAEQDDEIAIFRGSVPLLITAEHGTAHYRPDSNSEIVRKGPDLGTAGLGYVLREDLDAYSMVPLGRQTSDANFNEQHKFKDEMEKIIATHGIKWVISLHGMAVGKFSDFMDGRAYDVLLGIGEEPNDASLEFSQVLEQRAQRLDLRVATNEWFVKVVDDDPLMPEVNNDGTIAYGTFSAPYYTTRSFAQMIGEKYGLDLAAVQVELSSLLRLLPVDMKRETNKRQLGAYIGYRLLRDALETVISASSGATT